MAGGPNEQKVDSNMGIPRPRFDFTWNLNTVVILLGFGAGLVAWGYTLAEFRITQATNLREIADIKARVSALEIRDRILDAYGLRITSVENNLVSQAGVNKETQSSMNTLVTDVKVIREIVQRIESGN